MNILEDTNMKNKMKDILNLMNKNINNNKILDIIFDVNNDNELNKKECDEIDEFMNKNNKNKKMERPNDK